jgi:hypothetical protein
MQKLMAFVGLILALALLTINLPHITKANANEQVDIYDQQKKLVKSVVFALGVKEYFVNNQIPGVRMDVAPFIENGRTFVPVRFLGNALGVANNNIGWDEKKRLVTLAEPGFPKVELLIGGKTIKSNGQPKQMDVAPVIRDKRTFLPARFVAEALGYQVDWDPVNNIVICWPKGTEKPDVKPIIDHLDKLPGDKIIDVRNSTQTLGDKAKQIHFWFKPEDKVLYVTVDDLKKNDYRLDDTTIIRDIRVDKEHIWVKRYNAGGVSGCVFLIEPDGKARMRDPHLHNYPKGDFESRHAVVQDTRDKDEGWSTADITKVEWIMVDWVDTHLFVKNPLFEGGR